MSYILNGSKGRALPSLKGSLALFKATEQDMRVLITLAQLDAGEDASMIATFCDMAPEAVTASLEFWKRFGIVSECETLASEQDIPMPVLDKRVSEALVFCAQLIGRADVNFSEYEIEHLRSLMSVCDLDFIGALVKYYHEQFGKKFSFAYIEKVLPSLVERGISSADAFVRYTDARFAVEREARRLFGLGTTAFSDSQRGYLNKWIMDFGYDEKVFCIAYDIMADSANKRSFRYMDKIISKWHQNNLKTVDDILAFESDEANKPRASYGSTKKTQAQRAKIGEHNASFDPKAAFARALARSAQIISDEDGDK